ncbi:hypothetical protein STENM327S_02566 [Streptomyces tendae]
MRYWARAAAAARSFSPSSFSWPFTIFLASSTISAFCLSAFSSAALYSSVAEAAAR